jgi:hypothetical protein
MTQLSRSQQISPVPFEPCSKYEKGLDIGEQTLCVADNSKDRNCTGELEK